MAIVIVLEYVRSPKCFRDALLTSPMLAQCRQALIEGGQHIEIAPSGAKLFVHPWQVETVMEQLSTIDFELRPRHVIISEDLIPALEASVRSLPSRSSVIVKRRLGHLLTLSWQSRVRAIRAAVDQLVLDLQRHA